MGFLFVILGFPLFCSADATQFERKDNLYVTPTFELGARSQNYGASIGILHKDESKKTDARPELHGYTAAGANLRALAVAHDDKIEGGMVLYAFDVGGHGWEWLPMNLEFGVGSAFGDQASGLGVFEAGIFLGSAVTFQAGVISYTPLSTNDKPNWFPDWTIAIRYPLNLLEVASSKITVERKD